MKTAWHKWTERKPNKGEAILAVNLDYYLGNPAYYFTFMGNANISLIERTVHGICDNLYWIALPDGKEGEK